MDQISVMRAFCRIVELNSFSKAATDLGVSPALLSRETKLLEESLGCLLIARTTRSMSLTEHGVLYYDEAKRLLIELDELDRNIRDSAGALKGRLKVNAPLSFGLSVLSPMLPGFIESHPDLAISLNLDDRVLDMVEGGFDISIRVRAALPDSSLIARRLGTVKQQLFASPAYLAEKGHPVSPHDLADHSLLAFALADHATQWELMGDGGDTVIPIDPRIVINNSLFLRDMLVAGEGIGALPSFIFEDAVNSGALERVLPGYALPDRTIFAVVATRLASDAKTRTFLDYLADHVAGR